MSSGKAALVLLTLVLAGCASSAGGSKDDGQGSGTGFDDLDLKASETTGVIRGLVVDERVVPIEGAAAVLKGAGVPEQRKLTDAQGRFGFDELPPGTYFLSVTSLLHTPAQAAVEVLAGVVEPPVTKILLERLFDKEPYSEQFKVDGFIQCNQAGVYYGSAPCITDFTGIVTSRTGPQCIPMVRCCTEAGCAPELRRIQGEERGFTTSVGAGWQALVFEMVWEETSPTFDTMGITVSFNETARCACHNFASYGSSSPLRFQMNVGVDFSPSNGVEPELIPAEGIPDLYYFVGVRNSPALAVNQDFELFTHFFYYGLPPEGWSFVNGDELPF